MTNGSAALAYQRLKNTISNQPIMKRSERPKPVRNIISEANYKYQLLFSGIGFLLGRAVILGYLSPFGVAYLAVTALQELNISLIGVSLLLGVFSIGQKEILLKYIICTLIFAILYLLTSKINVNKKYKAAFAAAAANFAAGYFVFYIKNYYVYDLMMIIIESLLTAVLVFIYDSAFPVIRNFKNRRVLSTEEIVAFSILAAFCFVGTGFTVFGISIKNVCIILLVMLFSYFGSAGTGAAVGIILGIVQALSGSILPSAIGVYGLCGLMCGILKGIGKFGCPLGFILSNALMTFYINGSTEVLIRFYEILAASVVFMCIPRKLSERLFCYKTVLAPEYCQEKSFDRRVKEYTMEKLTEVSDVFNSLADTLRGSLGAREYFSQTDAAQIIDQVVSRVCSSCGMCDSCWKRDFYKSYQHFFNLLTAIESEGQLGSKAIPEAFRERCLQAEEVVNSINHFFDLYRNSLSWKKKVNESRMVVCEQLREVSTVVSDLAVKINMNVDFNREMEELIMVALDTQGVRTQDVIVTQSGGVCEIDIKTTCCGGKRECIKNIIPIVNKATGKKFVKKDMNCNVKQNNVCSIKLKEAHKYQIATGVARESKSGAISGDNYSFIELKDGKFMLALSDGMGTGPKAAMESNTTITLLEKFLYAGFDKDVAVKTINSLLLMKSNEDTYATIDMTVINQYNGEAEFIKVGAVSAFIKYEDRVEIIRSGSLPVGILNDVELEFAKKKLKDGDFIIMVTDGILDSNKKEINKEKWLADIIEDLNTRNPQKMAEDVLNKCIEFNDGVPVDDMLVMVAKVWETV